jgi:hypothetical protein
VNNVHITNKVNTYCDQLIDDDDDDDTTTTTTTGRKSIDLHCGAN